jgi:uncharacterized DUF497 family protein
VEFDWDDDNEEHIARHGVEPDEVFFDPRRVRASAYIAENERRRAVIGATDRGRLLYVVFTVRGGRIRVVSARDPSEREARRYRRR